MNKSKLRESPEQIKKRIIKLFNDKVRGRKSDTSKYNSGHDGKDGHWLETQMGLKHNGDNAPDLDGFEMKNNTTNKTTFGDWSPSRKLRIYKKGNEHSLTRSDFLRIFGAPNVLKENRYSWSGKPVPRIDFYNTFGQKLKIDGENNIHAIYSYSKDQRANKKSVVPKALQKEELILVTWDAELMRKRVENKFNKLGWFKCIKDKNGVYSSIVFGDPINFKAWIKGVKTGLIFFDSGMHDGNPRPYATWRADNKYWDSLVTDRY